MEQMNRCFLPDGPWMYDSWPWDAPCCSKPVIVSKQAKQLSCGHLHMNVFLCCHLRWHAKFLHRRELLLTTWSSARNLFINLVLKPLWDVLVSACCVEEFLHPERTWYSFMRSQMDLKTSPSRTEHITFTTCETLAIRVNVRLACCAGVSCRCCIITSWHLCSFLGVDIIWGWLGCWLQCGLGCCCWFLVVLVVVSLQCLLVLESTATKIAYQMIFLAMVKQILGGIKYQTRAKPTVIQNQGVKLSNMFHPHFTIPQIPVTLLTLNLVLTVLFYLTNSRVPLVSKRVQFWCADHFHCFLQVGVNHLGDLDVGIHVCLDCGCAGWTFACLTRTACRMVIHMVFHQQRFLNKSSKTYVTKVMTMILLTAVT